MRNRDKAHTLGSDEGGLDAGSRGQHLVAGGLGRNEGKED